MKAKNNSGITTVNMEFMRQTEKYTWKDYKQQEPRCFGRTKNWISFNKKFFMFT